MKEEVEVNWEGVVLKRKTVERKGKVKQMMLKQRSVE
jgi:hypothetical protein